MRIEGVNGGGLVSRVCGLPIFVPYSQLHKDRDLRFSEEVNCTGPHRNLLGCGDQEGQQRPIPVRRMPLIWVGREGSSSSVKLAGRAHPLRRVCWSESLLRPSRAQELRERYLGKDIEVAVIEVDMRSQKLVASVSRGMSNSIMRGFHVSGRGEMGASGSMCAGTKGEEAATKMATRVSKGRRHGRGGCDLEGGPAPGSVLSGALVSVLEPGTASPLHRSGTSSRAWCGAWTGVGSSSASRTLWRRGCSTSAMCRASTSPTCRCDGGPGL